MADWRWLLMAMMTAVCIVPTYRSEARDLAMLVPCSEAISTSTLHLIFMDGCTHTLLMVLMMGDGVAKAEWDEDGK